MSHNQRKASQSIKAGRITGTFHNNHIMLSKNPNFWRAKVLVNATAVEEKNWQIFFDAVRDLQPIYTTEPFWNSFHGTILDQSRCPFTQSKANWSLAFHFSWIIIHVAKTHLFQWKHTHSNGSIHSRWSSFDRAMDFFAVSTLHHSLHRHIVHFNRQMGVWLC